MKKGAKGERERVLRKLPAEHAALLGLNPMTLRSKSEPGCLLLAALSTEPPGCPWETL